MRRLVNSDHRAGAERGARRRKNMNMVDLFGATSTTDEVLSGMNLRGKRILVTGVSAGLGIETARSLAAHGANVVGAARDLNKAEAATTEVRRDAAAGGGSWWHLIWRASRAFELALRNYWQRGSSSTRLSPMQA